MLIYTYYDNKLNIDLTITVGQNAQENWNIIDNSSDFDIWFHLGNNMPSPHVVISVPDKKKIKQLSNNTIKYAASLCKMHSSKQYCNLHNLPVIYTNIKNVKKATKVGAVYTSYVQHITI